MSSTTPLANPKAASQLHLDIDLQHRSGSFTFQLNRYWPTAAGVPVDGAAGRDSDTCLSIERMKKEEILACPPVLLSPAERERFFEEGFLCLEGFAHESVAAMLAAADRAVARSAPFSAPHSDFSFDADHHRDQPRPSRLFRACEEDPAFSSYAFQAPLLDLVADLVGPAVRYREAYINYKWSRGGTKVDWHQDLAFLLHTNRAIVSTVTYLVDVTRQMAPLMVIPAQPSPRGIRSL